MRSRNYLVCVAAFVAASFLCQADDRKQPDVASDRPAECPDGHRELKDVPILYGKVSYDEQLQRDLADLKYVLGGCIVGKDSPKTAVICGECRFRYGGDGGWHKSSTNADQFSTPFSKVLLDSVKLFEPKDPAYYDQTVEGKRLTIQRVQFKCPRDRKTLDREVAEIMQRNGIRRENSRYDHEVFYGSDAESGVYQVWVLTDRGDQLLDLTISTKQRKKNAEKPQ